MLPEHSAASSMTPLINFEYTDQYILSYSATDEMYLLRSEKLYDSASSQVLDEQLLAGLTLDEVEFHESGPFYYISAGNQVDSILRR
jgi:hypothetical protein